MRPVVDAIAIDLDGTLLSRDGRVGDANIAALRRARDAGVQIVIATGRALTESLRILEAIGHDGAIVHAGGSMISTFPGGETIHHAAMCRMLVSELTDELVAHGHRALLLKDRSRTQLDYVAVGGLEFDRASEWWIMHHGVRVIHVHESAEDPHPDETVRVGAVARAEVLAPLAERLTAQLAGRCALQSWSAVTESQATGSATHLLEAFAPAANKSSAFRHWCALGGVDFARTAAIGDGLNDVEIVRDAGIGIAMSGGAPRVLAVADEIAPTVERDGVAAAIDRLLVGRWAAGTGRP